MMRRILSAALISFLPFSVCAEEAKPAAAFVDSMGINTHYNNAKWSDTVYASADTDKLVGALGIRHLRDNTENLEAFQRVTLLYKTYGIRTDMVVVSTSAEPQKIAQAAGMFPAIEIVEGLNEPDLKQRSYKNLHDNTKGNRYPATIAYQNELYAALKANPATARLPVLSPAMMVPARSQFLQGTSFDAISLHSYPVGQVPENRLDAELVSAAQMSKTPKPVVSTETGYYTNMNDHEHVSERAQAIYLPRLFGEYFNRGVARTYLYVLVDGKTHTDPNDNFGLLRIDGTPKPAYYALKNLTALLQDVPAKPHPKALDYNINGPSTVHHTLLSKADGSFDLLLWNEVSSWDTGQQKDIANAPVPITLTLKKKFQQMQVFLPSVKAEAVASFKNQAALQLNVPDQMMVVQLH